LLFKLDRSKKSKVRWGLSRLPERCTLHSSMFYVGSGLMILPAGNRLESGASNV
jgi:hypothetical protein